MRVFAVLAQQAGRSAEPHQESNESFLGLGLLLVVVLPLVLMAVLAWRRARSSPSKLPRFDDDNFDVEVLASQIPVLVHFARDWNVANRAALSQTELLAWQNRGAVKVGLLDIDANPRVMESFPALEPPAYVLYWRGRKLFHRPGLRQAAEIQQDIDVALSRVGDPSERL